MTAENPSSWNSNISLCRHSQSYFKHFTNLRYWKAVAQKRNWFSKESDVYICIERKGGEWKPSNVSIQIFFRELTKLQKKQAYIQKTWPVSGWINLIPHWLAPPLVPGFPILIGIMCTYLWFSSCKIITLILEGYMH